MVLSTFANCISIPRMVSRPCFFLSVILVVNREDKQTQLMLPKYNLTLHHFFAVHLATSLSNTKLGHFSELLYNSRIFLQFSQLQYFSLMYLFAVHLTAVLLTQVHFNILYSVRVQIIELH